MNPADLEAQIPEQRGVHIIEPRVGRPGGRMRELWAYRNLVGYFASRSVAKITSNTALGFSWLLMRPLLDTAARALVFGGVLQAPSLNTPYFLFFLVGMWAWRLFDRAVFWATRGIEINRKLVRKMYFPRILLPISSMAPALVEFAVYTVLVTGTLLWFGVVEGDSHLTADGRMLWVPVGLLMAFVFAVGMGLVTSVLGAYGRDTRYTLVYILDFWLFVTPVIYPLEAVPDKLEPLALANPMTPIVEVVKYGLIGAGQLRIEALGVSAGVILVTLAFGLWFFSRYEALSVDSV